MQPILSRLLKIGSFLLYSLFAASSARGQVTSDGTLTNPTEVNQSGNIFQINGGSTAGTNLFHSFRDFSLLSGQEAFFNNGENIVNIINRVTGGSISNIDGLIRANGSANLFLINPSGVVFGPNARLNVGGSFYGSTADGLLFEDGTTFSANNPQQSPLLTINVPFGLQLGNAAASITNQSTGLEVQPGQNLGLIGGNVTLDGGVLTAPGGTVELGGLLEAGTVEINNDGSLSFPDGVARADVSLSDRSLVDVRAGGGGFITVNARNIELQGESSLLAGIENLGTSGAFAGDIRLTASDAIAVSGNSSIENRVESVAIGNGGDILIVTDSLDVTDGSQVGTSTNGLGDAGNLSILANSILLDNQSIVSAETVAGEGNITLQALNIRLNNNSNIFTNAEGSADGGNITITGNTGVFADFVLLGNNSNIIANAIEGSGGNLTISSLSVFICSDCFIGATSSFGLDGTIPNLTEFDTELSADLFEIEKQITQVQTCSKNRGRNRSSFIITGKGGIPPRPTDVLAPDDLIRFERPSANNDKPSESTLIPNLNPPWQPIVEATGWYRRADGVVVLTANAPNVSPNNASGLFNSPGCHIQ